MGTRLFDMIRWFTGGFAFGVCTSLWPRDTAIVAAAIGTLYLAYRMPDWFEPDHRDDADVTRLVEWERRGR